MFVNFIHRVFGVTVDKATTEMITSYGSLIMMGGLIVSNINGFAQNFLKFLRYFFKSFLSEFITGEIILLISTQIVGVRYFICFPVFTDFLRYIF